MSESINAEPIEVDLSEETLEDLRNRLRNTRWPGVIGADDWTYGVPLAWLQEMIAYWTNDWDWTKEKKEINAYPHYRAEIDGLPIHFMSVPGKGPNPIPLILSHGWPWMFWDFKDVIGPLTDPENHGGRPEDAFHVVIPSLPGFGFSTPLTAAGIDVAKIADTWVQLMQNVCGFDRFAAHGGDWGALITSHLGHAHADVLIGAHIALPVIPGISYLEIKPEEFGEDEKWMIDRNAEARPLITSHVAVHLADPQTLGCALMDSPAATAAWLWQRRRNWSDCNGDVESVFSRDHLCTLAAIYWCTGACASSLRLYHEHFKKPWPMAHDRHPIIEAPTGFAVFPKDLVLLPRSVAERETNLHRWTVMPRGGHFSAAETPNLVVEDLRTFFAPLR